MALLRESFHRIDPAIIPGTTRGGHTLLVAGELAVARISCSAALQAVTVLYGFSCQRGGRRRSDYGQGGNGRENGERDVTVHGEIPSLLRQ
jgi:hypothetical protein